MPMLLGDKVLNRPESKFSTANRIEGLAAQGKTLQQIHRATDIPLRTIEEVLGKFKRAMQAPVIQDVADTGRDVLYAAQCLALGGFPKMPSRPHSVIREWA